MSAPRFFAPALLFITLAAAVGLHLVASRRQDRIIGQLRTENRLLDQETRLLRQQLEAERILAAAQARLGPDAKAQEQIARLTEKLRAADEDAATLLALFDTMRQTPPADAPRITHKQVETRYQNAKELARAGRHEEALAEYLWCYDKGMTGVASFMGVRSSFLLSEIAELGETYPPALEALRARRDQFAQAFADNPEDDEAMDDYASLNHTLGEDARTLALFDGLPAGDPRRARLGSSLYDDLAKSKRYADALDALPYDQMVMQFSTKDFLLNNPDVPESAKSTYRAHTLQSAASHIEVLVGSGKLDSAQDYAAQVLKFDDSTATRGLLHDAATRAGRPDLFGP